MSNWNWKVVRQFLKRSFDLGLSRSSCLNYLHRLGFVLKRPKKRLLKAKDEERKAFVLQYRQIREEAQESGAKIFFVDEAHFRADADLRGKWVLRGQPALVDSTSPRWGEKANYYSGVCLETGEVEAMEIAGNSNAETSTAFLQQLRENHPGPLVVIWDNGPAHRGEAIRSYLTTPELASEVGGLTGLQPRLQCRRSRLGLGQGRGHGQRMPGNKSPSTSPSRRTDDENCHAFAIAAKCSSQLGFGLGSGSTPPGPSARLLWRDRAEARKGSTSASIYDASGSAASPFGIR